MIQTGKVFLPFRFGKKTTRHEALDTLEASNAFDVKPELHSEGHLPDASHDFDRECICLDFLSPLLNRIAHVRIVLVERVSKLVREQKDNRVSKVPIYPICDCAFLACIVGNTECAKNRRKRSAGGQRCLA